MRTKICVWILKFFLVLKYIVLLALGLFFGYWAVVLLLAICSIPVAIIMQWFSGY